MVRKHHIALVLLSICLIFLAAGCKKPPPPPPPPPPPEQAPPPAPARPTVSITAEPSSIERGKSATLRWSSTNATGASLNQGIGAVPANGSREVFPTETTQYEVTVKGPGGEASGEATVTVRVPPPPPPPPPPAEDWQEVASRTLRDAYFDYDQSDIRSDAEAVMRANADALKQLFANHAQARIVIEGHCDERGTSEYNLALGDRRSTAAQEFLVNAGVPAGRLSTISYGKERPQCSDSNEDCWQRNRRAHFAPAQ